MSTDGDGKQAHPFYSVSLIRFAAILAFFCGGVYGSVFTTDVLWSPVTGALIAFTLLSYFPIGREFEVADGSARTGARGM